MDARKQVEGKIAKLEKKAEDKRQARHRQPTAPPHKARTAWITSPACSDPTSRRQWTGEGNVAYMTATMKMKARTTNTANVGSLR
jgi:hypothetical protein